MKLTYLPCEVVWKILRCLDERKDVLKARLISREWCTLATQLVFAELSLDPTHESIKKWIQLVRNPDIMFSARQLSIDTWLANGYTTLYNALEDVDIPDANDEDWFILSKLKDLFHLHTLKLRFGPTCARPPPSPKCPCSARFPDEKVEPVHARQEILEQVFQELHKRGPGSSDILCLRIENLQNYPLPDFTTSPAFKAIVGNLTELHLSIIVEDQDDDYFPERFEFEPYLAQHWLSSVGSQLTALSLSFNEGWSTAPGTFDGKGLHFPQIKRLSLGNYHISHNDHLDWVLNQTTLETLRFDSCRILTLIRWDRDLVSEWKIQTHDWVEIDGEPYDIDEDAVLYNFEGTWSFMFNKICASLPHLAQFQFDTTWAKRYTAFPDTGFWVTWGTNGEVEFAIDGDEARHKETEEQDKRTLDSLMETISKR